MSLRTQTGGFQKPWTLAEVTEGFKKFFLEYGRYPTSQEVDEFPHLPSARSLQRTHGGLVAMRKKLALSKQYDFTKGEYSSKRAHTINEDAKKHKEKIFIFLKNKFGTAFVHRDFFLTDDSRSKIDFYIYYEGGVFALDVFNSQNRHSLIGCLNAKLNTYAIKSMSDIPIIFLQINHKITKNTLLDILEKKKKKLLQNQFLMNHDDFMHYCHNKSSLPLPYDNQTQRGEVYTAKINTT